MRLTAQEKNEAFRASVRRSDLLSKAPSFQHAHRCHTCYSDFFIADTTGSKHQVMDSQDSYFPPMEEYSKDIAAVAPLLPTPSTTDTLLPIFDNSTPRPPLDTPEHLPAQSCSCPMSDPCILETLGLLQGSMCLLELAVQHRGCSKEIISAVKAGRCQVEDCMGVLLPSLDRVDSGQHVSTRSLLMEHSSNATGQDVCCETRRRIQELGFSPVDTLSPLQHSIHVLLTLLGLRSIDFRTAVQELECSIDEADNHLMEQALENLSRCSVKVYASQYQSKLAAFEASIEELSFAVFSEHDEAKAGKTVQCVAIEVGMSYSTPKLLSVPKTTFSSTT